MSSQQTNNESECFHRESKEDENNEIENTADTSAEKNISDLMLTTCPGSELELESALIFLIPKH